MPRVPYNSVGGFSTGLTMTGVIDDIGNITGAGATFSGLIRANAGISAAGGVTLAGTLQGTTATFTGILKATSGISASTLVVEGGSSFGAAVDHIFGLSNRGLKINAGKGNSEILTYGNDDLSVNALGGNGTLNLFGGNVTVGDDGNNNGTQIIVDDATSQSISYTAANGHVFNGVGSFSGLLTASAGISASGITVGRIVSGGTSGINLEPGSGILNVIGGISASGGFTFGSISGTTWMTFIPQTSCSNGGLWIKDGILQIGGSAPGSGAFFYSPCGERFDVYGYGTINNSYNYQAGRAPLRLNGAPTQSVPILAAYKQTSDGTQLTNTFTTTNMVAGIDQNGALFSTVGVCAAGGITFTNNVQANGYILTSNARSWFL